MDWLNEANRILKGQLTYEEMRKHNLKPGKEFEAATALALVSIAESLKVLATEGVCATVDNAGDFT